jgi:hypothetical protein
LSSNSHLRRILIVALILVVVSLASVGSYFTFYRPTPPYTATSMFSGATGTSSTQASGSETTSTTVVPVQWMTVEQVESIDYYLSLLESNSTARYVQLATELRKLPDLGNATAVAKITYLALNARNPEVKEAFQLMMFGGTPAPQDLTYVQSVSNFNTEPEVLYWLACQNRFKEDDTLVLATAMTHGLWVTMGDWDVMQAVHKDVSDFLVFLRTIADVQRERGYFNLESYPLEAKICLAWRSKPCSYMVSIHPR